MASLHELNFIPALSGSSIALSASAIALCKLIGYGLFNAWQNAYNHPLSKFPGPPTASFSNISYVRRFMSGRQPFEMVELHKKYGATA
ncbi:MAG: hypothetical protein Q9214_001882 [Letrouitia sp. 1 TL-2023]